MMPLNMRRHPNPIHSRKRRPVIRLVVYVSLLLPVRDPGIIVSQSSSRMGMADDPDANLSGKPSGFLELYLTRRARSMVDMLQTSRQLMTFLGYESQKENEAKGLGDGDGLAFG